MIRQKSDRYLSSSRKALYTAVLALTFFGASSSVLGLLPLGEEATSRDRALGMIQFLLCLLFSHGTPYTHAMNEVIGQLDNKLTSYLQSLADEGSGRCSAIRSDIREMIRNAQWQEVLPLIMALLIAAYSPMLDALNAREGIINLITGVNPARQSVGEALGNIMIVLNWAAGFALPAVMASSLFDGYKKDFRVLRNGSAVERENVDILAEVFRKKMVLTNIHGNDKPLNPEQLARIVSPELSVDAHVLRELLRTDEQSSRCMELLTELGLDTADDRKRVSREQREKASIFLASDPAAGKMIRRKLSEILDSPALSKKVLKTLRGQPVQYSNATERAKATGRLAVRVLVNWLALNGLSVTFAAPLVVNHYRQFYDNSTTMDVDCHYLQNNSARIEPFDNTLFELGIGSYMAQGLSLSDAAIKTLELLLIPLSFMLSGCDMDNMNRAWKAVWRDFDKFALMTGGIGAAAFAWVVSSAGEKYQEYLELLDCDISVPDSRMVVEFDSAAVLTQVLMTIILLHLCTSSFKTIFGKLPVVHCQNPCGSETPRHEQPVPASDAEAGENLSV